MSQIAAAMCLFPLGTVNQTEAEAWLEKVGKQNEADSTG